MRAFAKPKLPGRPTASWIASAAAIHRRHHRRTERRRADTPNLVANTLQCRAVIAPYLAEEQGSVLTPLPLYHIFSLTANLLAFALMGGSSVLVPDPRDIKGLIRTMRRTQVSTMTGVNTLSMR